MTEAVLRVGEVVHVVFRRAFEDDVRRHFVGEVVAVSGPVARVRGFAFVHDSARNEWERVTGLRERIVPLGGAGCVVHVLPEGADPSRVVYRFSEDQGRMVVTDGRFTLEVNEFGPDR